MSRIPTLFLLAALSTAAVALAAAPDPRTDRELRTELRELDREIDRQGRLAEKLSRAGRSSSNTGRISVMEDLREHMAGAVVRREDILGQEHTIKQHGAEVGDLTDAAEVGTPMASKKTRRRVRKGEAEEHPEALRRLTRLQTIFVSARRIQQPASERQEDTFERYSALVEEFGDILAYEHALVQVELDRRAAAAAEADSLRAAQ
jgi:hypothetical protein